MQKEFLNQNLKQTSTIQTIFNNKSTEKLQNQGYINVGDKCSGVCDIFALFLYVKKSIFFRNFFQTSVYVR